MTMTHGMRLFIFFACLWSMSTAGRTKGVKKSDESKYSGPTFTCDEGHSIDISMVNDNFCDCLDGSDEPGTSACSNSLFYCVNAGFKGTHITASRVGDGICDCCDGSDEATGHCAPTCADLAKQQAEELNQELAFLEKGVRLKNEWIENSKTWKSVIEEELQTLEEELEAIVEEFEIAKERKEEIEVEQKEEQDRLLAEWEERQAAKKAAEEVQAETAEDSQEANTELDATSDQDAGEDVPTTPGEDEEENFPYPAEYAAPPQGGKATEEEQEEEEEENFPYPAEYAAPSGEDEEESEDSPEDATDDEEAKEEEKEEEDKDEKPDYKHPDMGSARSDFTNIQKERTSKENDLKAKKEMLETDFGGDNEWYPMYKNCYDVKIKQYTYEICPFEKSTQKEGSSRTNLGTYKNEKWNSKEGKMFFEDGQKCWNGPKRSLEVRYECRDEVKVLSVDEPSKCVYVAIMGTPAACDEETLNGLRLASDFGLDEEEGHH